MCGIAGILNLTGEPVDPCQLRRMIELWWTEAGRNHVLPLMDGFFNARL